MEKISAAVLGCGGMGRTIISQISASPYIESIVGYDVSEESLQTTKDKFPELPLELTMDLNRVLDDPKIKLVYISTPNVTHVPLAVKAMRAGKSVMTEKPSGISYEQIDELLRVQKETGAFLQVGLELRYSKVYRMAKEYIDKGEIGKLVNIHFTYSNPPYSRSSWRVLNKNSGGMCLEKLCHYIDCVRWWNGSRVCEYVATNAPNVIPYFEIKDNIHISYRFENETVSQLFFTMTASPGYNNDPVKDGADLFDQDRLGHKLNYIIMGTEGSIEIDIFQRELRLLHHTGKPSYKGKSAEIVQRYNWDKSEDHLNFHDTKSQNLDIIHRVMNGLPPSISLEDASETMRLCLEFEEASVNHPWKVIKR
jgi:predicted dehydrogenase